MPAIITENLFLMSWNLYRCCAELPKAYEIIAANRAHKGFPLRMTLEQVLQTATVIPIDAFTVNKNKTPIASAIVYRVNNKVAQVIYWGDLPGHSECRPMYII